MGLSNIFKKKVKFNKSKISNFALLEVDELDEGVWKHTLNQILDYEGDNWRDFERFIAWLLKKQGYDVTLTQPFSDGGKDIIINIDEGEVYVEVKIRKTEGAHAIGKEYVNRLAKKVNGKVIKGIMITNHYFTSYAHELADMQQIELIDRKGLINLVSRICPDMVSKSFYERERDRIGACPKCEGVLLKKQNRETGDYFKGCSNFHHHGCDYQEKFTLCKEG